MYFIRAMLAFMDEVNEREVGLDFAGMGRCRRMWPKRTRFTPFAEVVGETPSSSMRVVWGREAEITMIIIEACSKSISYQ